MTPCRPAWRPDRAAPRAPTSAEVVARLAEVRGRIAAAGGDPRPVKVVAVTKGFGPEAVAAATGAGLWDIGENYAQELLAKAAEVPAGVPLAFPRPASSATRWPAWPRSWPCGRAVDRAAVGEAIARRAPGRRGPRPGQRVAARPPRPGAARRRRPRWSRPPAAGPRRARAHGGRAGRDDRGRPGPASRLLAALARQLELAELSMGMSGDLEIAVEEGSTMVRIGRSLFGPRPGTPRLRR